MPGIMSFQIIKPLFICILTVFILNLSIPSTFAQDVKTQEQNNEDILSKLKPILETARETGATIVVIDPSKQVSGSVEPEIGFDQLIYNALLPARADARGHLRDPDRRGSCARPPARRRVARSARRT